MVVNGLIHVLYLDSLHLRLQVQPSSGRLDKIAGSTGIRATVERQYANHHTLKIVTWVSLEQACESPEFMVSL